MDLNAVDLFAKVVEFKSFTIASLKTGVPTSSISRKISELEANLNVQLLERTTRKLRVTEKGRIFYENIRPAVETLKSARLHLLDDSSTDIGTLRLSVPPGLEKSLVIPLLSRFQKCYPGIKLKVIITGANLNFIEDGIDVALRVGTLKDSNLIAVPLLEYTHVLVAGTEYIKERGLPKTPDCLPNHNLVSGLNWFDDTIWKFTKENDSYTLNVNESISLNHYGAIQLAIEENMGIGELPIVNCRNLIKQGHFIAVIPDWKLTVYGDEKLKLSIVYTANRYNSVSIKKFKMFCVEYFKRE